MANSIWLLFGGGAVSLVSTVSGIILKHWLDGRVIEKRVKEYPIKMLCDKLTEFFDKVAPILADINGYLSGIDVWLVDLCHDPDAKKRAREAAKNGQPMIKLWELMKSYFIYLPKDVLECGNGIFAKGVMLQEDPSSELIWECFDLLFQFQNLVRKFAGTDRLSSDLLRSFGQRGVDLDQRSQII